MIRRLRAQLEAWRRTTATVAATSKRVQRIEQALDETAARLRGAAKTDVTPSRLEAIEAQLERIVEQQELMSRHLRHLLADVDGLVRRAYLDPDTLPYPERLTARRFRLKSQNQEDGLLWALFQEIGITSSTFVELGCGASGGNAAMLAEECGWTGLMVEGNPGSAGYAARRFTNCTVTSEWITPETINTLLERHGYAREVDLLSLDIDGNDYWVWEALTATRARVVVLEYNSMFGPDRAVTISYDPAFNRRDHRFCYYGASLAALTKLSARKGYRLVAVEPSGINAFFLRNDLAPHIPACEPTRAFHMSAGYNQQVRDKAIDIFAWAAETGRHLVEV
jgi:hypothetical protein